MELERTHAYAINSKKFVCDNLRLWYSQNIFEKKLNKSFFVKFHTDTRKIAKGTHEGTLVTIIIDTPLGFVR